MTNPENPLSDPALAGELEAAIAEVLDQLTDADPADDEVRDLH